jgi:hypothetical protein
MKGAQMNANGLVKHYDELTADERFVLTMRAVARDDDAELTRLSAASSRFNLSMSDMLPYIEAFHELVLTAFIELLDLAAHFDEALMRVWGAVDRGGAAWPELPKAPLANQMYAFALAAGYLLKLHMAGWRLWCESRHIPPLTFMEGLPGYERMMRTLKKTEEYPYRPSGLAFTRQEMLNWWNRVARHRGEPELGELPCTAEKIADGFEWLFEDRRRCHAGK